MEAEGRLFGGRRPTPGGLGAKPPAKWGPLGPYWGPCLNNIDLTLQHGLKHLGFKLSTKKQLTQLHTSLDNIIQTGVPSRAPKGPILLGASPPDPPASAFGLHKVGLRPPWVPVRAGLGPNIIIYYIWAQPALTGTHGGRRPTLWRPKADAGGSGGEAPRKKTI